MLGTLLSSFEGFAEVERLTQSQNVGRIEREDTEGSFSS